MEMEMEMTMEIAMATEMTMGMEMEIAMEMVHYKRPGVVPCHLVVPGKVHRRHLPQYNHRCSSTRQFDQCIPLRMGMAMEMEMEMVMMHR